SDLLESDDHAPIIKLINAILTQAVKDNASDIHIEPFENRLVVRFRVDGVLREALQSRRAVAPLVVSRIKVMSKLDIAEKRLPQDGRISLRIAGRAVDVRVSTIPAGHGERVVLRLLDKQAGRLELDSLGMDPKTQKLMDELIHKPHGILLVTGPTGSGKTTTLYSTLKQVALPEVNVCTIEDPIEMVEPQFNQMQVQHGIGLDFATGVRTLMRQDPDIIMVGEIRDMETAEIAIQAALTGHLVFSTLHTNDAPSALTRLLDIGVPPYLLHSTILAVMAQRLVRTLCPLCREAGAIDDSTWNMLIAPWQSEKPKQVYNSKGCLECRMTGYSGRIGIYEILLMTAGQRPLITAETDAVLIREQAYRDGMKPLRIGGALKVAAGVTTVDEVLKVAPPIADDRRKKP
ncbi:MAG TPA: GspE/PulE family protein, partial [Burkholderiales bacterium]|nr:GspE/PulE family protein [Burkholderiales bacterium]